MLGKIEGRTRRGWQRMGWLDDITNSKDMSLRKLWEIVKYREVWHAVHGVTESDTTEQLSNNKARRPEGCKFERGTESLEMGWCLLVGAAGEGTEHEQRHCGMVFVGTGETSE